MWPFKKKEPERNCAGEAIEKLQEFKKIGETFNYLGRTCIVTGHWEFWPCVGVVPLLQFDYADDTGKIHNCKMRVTELPALINQQLPNNK